jgi:hypothetical protein
VVDVVSDDGDIFMVVMVVMDVMVTMVMMVMIVVIVVMALDRISISRPPILPMEE